MKVSAWAGLFALVMPLVACRERRVPPPPDRSEVEAETAFVPPEGRTVRSYHVSPEGEASGDGSSEHPFRELQQAADVAEPGDTVLVHPGAYTGGDRIVTVSRSGAPGQWITYRSGQKWRAILDGRDGASLEGWYFGPGVSYIRVEGFEIKDLHEHGFDTYGGGVHDLLIARNLIHGIGRNCTDTSNGRTGASLGAGTRRVTFDGNVWRDIGRLAPGEKGCSPKTEYYQNHDHGIYVADADQVTVINNVFYSFARGWAVHRYYSRGGFVRQLLIANNTFVGDNPYRPGQIILATPTLGLRIENNIFYSPNSAALYFENLPFPEAVVRYNLVYGGELVVGQPRNVTFMKNREGDPKFSDRNDFRLSAGSPAIDAGVPLGYVSHDADGAARPRGRGYDLGAYER